MNAQLQTHQTTALTIKSSVQVSLNHVAQCINGNASGDDLIQRIEVFAQCSPTAAEATMGLACPKRRFAFFLAEVLAQTCSNETDAEAIRQRLGVGVLPIDEQATRSLLAADGSDC